MASFFLQGVDLSWHGKRKTYNRENVTENQRICGNIPYKHTITLSFLIEIQIADTIPLRMCVCQKMSVESPVTSNFYRCLVCMYSFMDEREAFINFTPSFP